MNMLLEAGAAATDAAAVGTAGGSMLSLILTMGAMFLLMYFMMIRPQKKEQKRMAAMLASLATGDVVLTTSGFYGVVIDINDDMVIVEFGSNKNCRIPMEKGAISRVEKQNEA